MTPIFSDNCSTVNIVQRLLIATVVYPVNSIRRHMLCAFIKNAYHYIFEINKPIFGGSVTTLQNVTCDEIVSASYSIDFSKRPEKESITCRRCQHKIVFYKSQLLSPKTKLPW